MRHARDDGRRAATQWTLGCSCCTTQRAAHQLSAPRGNGVPSTTLVGCSKIYGVVCVLRAFIACPLCWLKSVRSSPAGYTMDCSGHVIGN